MASNSTGTTITPDHQGPLVNVIAWVLMVIMIMASATKIGNTIYCKRPFKTDDYLLIAAALVAIGQTISVAQQVGYGLGDPAALADPNARAQYEQSAYASQILYVIVLYLTKAVTSCFVGSVAPMKWVSVSTMTVLYGHLAWTVVSIFVVAFQCSLPHPWAIYENKCLDMAAFWDAYAAVDIAFDIALIVIPILVIVHLQTSRRSSIIIPFGSRFILIPLVILRVVFINMTYATGRTDQTDEVKAALVTEVHMHMAIVLTCAPFIKHIIEGMQAGAMTSDLLYGPAGVRATKHYGSQNGSHPLSNVSKAPYKNMKMSGDPSTASTTRLHETHNNWVATSIDERSRAASPTPPSHEHIGVARGTDIAVHTTITTSVEHV